MKKLFISLTLFQAVVASLILVWGSSLSSPPTIVKLERFQNVTFPKSERLTSAPNPSAMIHDQVIVWAYEKTKVTVGTPVTRQAVILTQSAPKRAAPAIEKEPPYQINNQERFVHYGFDYQAPETTSWSVALNEKALLKELVALHESTRVEEPIVQEVKMVASTSQKMDPLLSVQDDLQEQLVLEVPENETRQMTDDQEIVMMDYTEESEAPLTQEKLVESVSADLKIGNMIDDLVGEEKISETLRETIGRVTSSVKQNATEASAPVQAADYSASAPVIAAAAEMNTQKNDYSAKSSANGTSRNRLSFYPFNIDEPRSSSAISDIEFFTELIQEERFSTRNGQDLYIEIPLNSQMGVLTGVLLASEMMRTKLDLVLEEGDYELAIPMISQYDYHRFLEREGLQGQGGHLLVQLDSRVDTVEIDSYYEAKVFLNKNFKVVEQSEEHDFILFVGVKPGNTLLSAKTFRDGNAQKILHITEDELTFDGGSYVRAGQDFLEFENIQVLGRRNSPLNIYGDQLKYFNTNISGVREGLGSYSLKTPSLMSGMRKYLEFNHLQGKIYAGYWDEQKIKLPSQELVHHVLEAHGLNSLGRACMLQVNFTEQVADVSVLGESDRGPMVLLENYLDEDGYWSQEATEMSERLFIVGEYPGAISVRVRYISGQQDFLRSYCSANTYLVEQL